MPSMMATLWVCRIDSGPIFGVFKFKQEV